MLNTHAYTKSIVLREVLGQTLAITRDQRLYMHLHDTAAVKPEVQPYLDARRAARSSGSVAQQLSPANIATSAEF